MELVFKPLEFFVSSLVVDGEGLVIDSESDSFVFCPGFEIWC